ncbi:ABC transporter permease [Mesoterricola sediminis]|uniref:Multidrug ABC transporter substrate-binding protein n=1 Tax=Mesoterricola sediminis TaxID=2927980 RepID=A0AA48H288_9BACT|nr:ABC transporter permease [Mesoterricola sediminis]BDU78645.1 multidrug ABC transporter substrate-binding protein [Mesoterricola sediminis]
MNILDFIKLAFSSIVRNKTRAFLTMLGIIIGVGAVIAMIGIGQGSKKASIEIIQNMGSNMLTIFNGGGGSNSRMGPMGMGSVPILLEDDAALIERELSNSSVVAATPQVRANRACIYQNNNAVTTIQGSGVQFLQIRGWEVLSGRFFTEQEVKGQAKVCVLGTTVRDELFPDGEDPVGKTIRIAALPFEVVGVLESKGAGMMGDQDDVIVAPYKTVMRKIIGVDRIQNIMVSAQEGKADLAEMEITALLRQRLRLTPKDENPFMIRKQDDWVKMQDQQASVLTTFLAMAASISLIVGGIGISNIMLVSVTERTREIGVRRALGATRHSVLMQFLTEAVVLSILGGLIGVGLAYLIIWILKYFAVLPAVAEPWAVALGLGFSGVVGIIAGFLPALKAAKLDVIDALRYE